VDPANPAALLTQFVEQIRQRAPTYDWQPTVEPQQYLERALRPIPPPVFAKPAGDIDEARRIIRTALTEYLEERIPTEMLLIRTSPGTGKTTLAVEAADFLAASGRRVAYAGPRHDLYPDVIAKSSAPDAWYEWLPRQGDDAQSCRHAGQMESWLQRGYAAMDFCSGVCHWDYIKDGCPYHRQRSRTEPVIYIQHQHITNGHPVRFDVLFGDESPIQAFCHEWRIPARWVMPPGMDYALPLTSILHVLGALCSTNVRPIQGPELIEILGGADEVIEACETFEIPAETIQAATTIHRPEEADGKPYFHLFKLVPLLLREARLAKSGTPYPWRLIAANDHLTMLLRSEPDYSKLPGHIVWMDATGRPEIYEQIFRRQVRVIEAAPRLFGRIYQVVDRANGKKAMENAGKRDQAKTLIQRIIERYGYERPTIGSFKDFVANSELGEGVGTTHFGAARGTNAHQDSDVMIVLGAPQPNFYDLVKIAKMLFFERDEPFDVTWCTRDAAYHHIAEDGQGRSYPVSGFWRDPALQLVLEMTREDEIIQVAHRIRPDNHEGEIWLLTNIPIDSLPPDELLTMRQVMDAPERVDVFKWATVQAYLSDRDSVTIADLVEGLGINYETAKNYLSKIIALPGWEPWQAVRTGKRGRPALFARRNNRG